MTLSKGTRLGVYEILSPIGAGGMGEVYRARDTTLARDVAIKVLPDAFAADPERIARFQREARTLASLNHPHIASIYGVEETAGLKALVLELVEGPTLADRILQGPIPIDEALPIAKQIVEALEAAHERGIVHRDLKPANIKLTADATVKVLDFGLAKPTEPAPGVAADLTRSPTLTSPAIMTGFGSVVGTAAYMSPEQAKGYAADHRSDIWAFGCVLYEMLTGRRSFAGDTVSETLAAVLKEEPDVTRAPARVRRLLHVCLQKDPKQRLQAIGDSRLLLDDGVTPAPDTKSRLAWAVAAALAVVAAFSLWAPWRRVSPDLPLPAVRLDFDLGGPMALNNLGPDAILSPDGTRIVVVVQGSDGRSRLSTRRLEQSQSVELRGSEGAYAPFFSPDSRWVAFFAGGKLKKTRVDGGEPITLCDVSAGRGGSWGEDDNLVVALGSQTGLSLVPSAGGKIVPLTTLAPGESSHRWPHVLPGGRIVLFTSSTTFANFDEANISALSLMDRTWKIVLERGGMYPHYVSTNHLIYVTRGTLFGVPFDPVSVEVRGRPAPLIEDVSNDTGFGFSRFDTSASGMLLYRRGRTAGLRTIHWMDRTGRMDALEREPAVYLFPRVSPDGSRLIWTTNQGGSTELWIYDWQRGSKTRLTDGKSVNTYPVWSPDGQYIVFSSPGGIFWTRADGAGKPQPLTASKALQHPTSFMPDGKRLVFAELSPAGGLILTVAVDGGSGQLRAGSPELFLKTPSELPFPAFSPDGRWLAYADAESGHYEVYVRAFPDKGTRWLISTGGGTMPVWSRNGRELFYRTEDSQVMVASYAVKGDTFVADRPRVWSETRLANSGLAPNFDLAPDATRLVVLMPAEGPEPPEVQRHVTLVTNFFDELRHRVPQGSK